MKKLLLTLLLLLSLGFAASAAELTLTTSSVGMSGTSYSNYSKVDAESGLSIALRASNNTGICFNKATNNCYLMVTENKNNVKINSVTITFNTTNTKPKIEVYKSESAYTKASTDADCVTNVTSSTHVTQLSADGKAHNVAIEAPYFGLTYSGSNMVAMTSIVIDYSPASTTPEITAASGETTYTAGETPNEVAKGTEVTFTVTNCEDTHIASDPALTFTNGTATAVISSDATYTIMAGEEIAEFVFKVVKPTISADKIVIKANDEVISAEDIELYAGTELAFSYAEAIEGVTLSYTTDAETYTEATSYIFNPGNESEVAIFVKAAYEDVSDEKVLNITKKAVAAPTFNIENGSVSAGATITVRGENVAWTVARNGGEAETITGNSYTVNDEIGTALAFSAVASVTLNDITTSSEPAALEVTVEEATEAMFDFTTNPAYGLQSTTTSYESATKEIKSGIVTLTLSGSYRLTTLNGGNYCLRLHASQNNAGKGTMNISVPDNYYITGVTFGAGSTSSNAAVLDDAGSISDNKWTFGEQKLSSVSLQRGGNANPSFTTITVEYAELVPSIATSNIEIKHGKAAGVVTVNYTFEVANHNGGEFVVTAAIDGKEHIQFETVPAPAAAPARAAGENTVVSGTLKAKHDDLKGVSGLPITVKATLDGKELYNVTHTEYTTTGIEDVTIDADAPAEYFNLQGVRVAEPQAGQVYIVRRGATVTKELVK